MYFKRDVAAAWKSLGGVLLSFTGVEIFYADLGAFNATAIRVSWLGFGWPCLLLAYSGQAAYLSREPSGYSNPFFNSLPHGMFWPGMIFAILTAIVASQAMITAIFQLLSQVMSANYAPRLKIKHTSRTFFGQVYIGTANWTLMVGAVIVTAVYNNTTKLGHAYGACVILVTMITTFMVAIAEIIIWKANIVLALASMLFFMSIECLYLSSAMTKFPDGAWLTVLLAGLLATVLFVWRNGKEKQWKAEKSDIIPLSRVIKVEGEGILCAFDDGNKTITKVKGNSFM